MNRWPGLRLNKPQRSGRYAELRNPLVRIQFSPSLRTSATSAVVSLSLSVGQLDLFRIVLPAVLVGEFGGGERVLHTVVGLDDVDQLVADSLRALEMAVGTDRQRGVDNLTTFMIPQSARRYAELGICILVVKSRLSSASLCVLCGWFIPSLLRSTSPSRRLFLHR
jgi:hypothetical protein